MAKSFSVAQQLLHCSKQFTLIKRKLHDKLDPYGPTCPIVGGDDEHVVNSTAVEMVRRCRYTRDGAKEIDQMKLALHQLLQHISSILAKRLKILRFKSVLSGSMAEGTKVYQPDEFDYICLLDAEYFACSIDKFDTVTLTSLDPALFQVCGSKQFHSVYLSSLFYHGVEFALKEIVGSNFCTASHGVVRRCRCPCDRACDTTTRTKPSNKTRDVTSAQSAKTSSAASAFL